MPSSDLHRQSSMATLGLGGNVGDPRRTMSEALKLLDADPAIDVEAVSRLYRTPPWGPVDQDWFLNCCAVVRTVLPARRLLDTCKEIEHRLKREKTVRWGPRNIDIDILTYDNLSVTDDRLIIPHPRMHERGFVLLPLVEIAADVEVDGKSVKAWSRESDNEGIEAVTEDGRWWRAG